MKRILIIVSFFAVIFGAFCITSCARHESKTITVEKYNMCSGTGRTETFEGRYNSCSGSYRYTKMCGCYENDLQSDYFEGCMPSSCVVCGCDLTLMEWYRLTDDNGTDADMRSTATAVEGRDYVINKMTVVVGDHIEEFYDVGMNWDDISDAMIKFISLINLETAADVEFYVEYTALTELHSAEFSASFVYDGGMSILNNTLKGVRAGMGNADKEYVGQDNYKSKNIQPGKHIISATASFNMYELLALEDITNVYFSVVTYVEE